MRQKPHAATATDQFLALLLDEMEAQGEVLRQILDRLPQPAQAALASGSPQASGGEGEGEPVPVAEPAPPSPPGKARPVGEPAKPTPPGGARPVSEPAPKREPRRGDDDRTSLPPPPPRAGKGSGKEAWSSFANIAKVLISERASRDDIIAACVRAGVIEAE